jgi:hypothetical protein
MIMSATEWRGPSEECSSLFMLLAPAMRERPEEAQIFASPSLLKAT